MIEKLTEGEMIHPIEVGKKINEIIDVVNSFTSSFTMFEDVNIKQGALNKPYDQFSEHERIHETDGA